MRTRPRVSAAALALAAALAGAAAGPGGTAPANESASAEAAAETTSGTSARALPAQLADTARIAADTAAAGAVRDDDDATGVEATGAVAVTAVGVRAEQGGDLVFALFRGAAGWPKVERAPLRRSAPAASESVAVVFAGVPSDTSYAVLVLHDRNGNGKLDMRVFPFPKPKEGAGVSRNRTRMGPPRYEAARFAVGDTLQSLRVVLRY